MKFPKLKKKISQFLPDESGKTTKHALMLLATIIGGAAIHSAIKSKDVSAATPTVTVDKVSHIIYGTHSHHSSHGSHGSY